MRCPHCRAKTDDSAERCGLCGASLALPLPDAGSEDELQVLLKTSDLARLAVIKSLLDSAGIEYMAQGEEGPRSDRAVRSAAPRRSVSRRLRSVRLLPCRRRPR